MIWKAGIGDKKIWGVEIQELKQEAIKWVKNRIDRIAELQEAIETNQREMWISQNEAVVIVFKKFFNITEAELQ